MTELLRRRLHKPGAALNKNRKACRRGVQLYQPAPQHFLAFLSAEEPGLQLVLEGLAYNRSDLARCRQLQQKRGQVLIGASHCNFYVSRLQECSLKRQRVCDALRLHLKCCGSEGWLTRRAGGKMCDNRGRRSGGWNERESEPVSGQLGERL
jgi:hypothetical protein